jgi:hypothetical protein
LISFFAKMALMAGITDLASISEGRSIISQLQIPSDSYIKLLCDHNCASFL